MGEFVGRASTDTAMQLLREGKLSECIACLDRVISAYPDNALAYSILGAAYARAGDNAMSIGAFEKALAEEESPRSHTNLAKAYEAAGREQDAIRHYQAAAQIDPFYQQAAEALKRLGVEPPGTAEDAHEPHLLSDDGPQPAYSGGIGPVGIPTFTPPTTPAAPDLRDLEIRARETEEKARKAQKQMTKAGLIYGIIVGPICLLLSIALTAPLMLIGFKLIYLALAGALLGGIVGAWNGFANGDEWSGAKTGALCGAIGMSILFIALTRQVTVIVITAPLGAFVGAVAGLVIGKLVEMSIG